MLHYIENEYLICTIESQGAEIRSLKDKQSGKEYIWQIREEVWASSSPVLFPAIGSIKEGKWRYKGVDYAMPKHGIIRHNDDLVFEQTAPEACHFSLAASDKTRMQYPFNFHFKVEYVLEDRKLKMLYHIQNLGEEPMPFICGGHTAYACPLDEETSLSDYVIDFPGKEELLAETLAASGYLDYKQRRFALENGALRLSDQLFDEDALIFVNVGVNRVSLRKAGESKGLEVHFKGYPHLALWSKPGADYVCIEPWLGLPDREDESIEALQKTTMRILEPRGLFTIGVETVV